jgi:hypothetical protein
MCTTRNLFLQLQDVGLGLAVGFEFILGHFVAQTLMMDFAFPSWLLYCLGTFHQRVTIKIDNFGIPFFNPI